MLAPSLFPFHSDHGFRHLFDHYDKGVRGGYQSTWGLIDDLDDGPSWSTRSRLECATTCSTMDGCTSAWFRPNGACVLGIFRDKIIILLMKMGLWQCLHIRFQKQEGVARPEHFPRREIFRSNLVQLVFCKFDIVVFLACVNILWISFP